MTEPPNTPPNNDASSNEGISFDEELAKKIQAKKISNFAAARIYVQLNYEKLRADIAKAGEIKLIWETLYEQGTIKCQYSKFCGLVRMFSPPPEKPQVKTETPPPLAPIIPAYKKGAKGFTFNPIPNKEELLK